MHNFVIVSIRVFGGVLFIVFDIVYDCDTEYGLTNLLYDLCSNFYHIA